MPFNNIKNAMTFFRAPKVSLADNVVSLDAGHGIQVCRGTELLKESPYNLNLIKQTKQTVSVTKDVWDAYYFPVIARVASLMQRLPASENYHHNHVNGLLTHSLEVMSNACRISTGYILPPNMEAESISANVQRWRAGVMIAALLHDAGKLLLDVEIMVTTDGKKYTKFYPLFDTWPEKGFYRFRYANKKVGHTKKLHERAAPLSFHKVINKRLFDWLCEDPMLMQQLLDSLCYMHEPDNIIAEIVLKADRASVARAVGDSFNQNTNTDNSQKVSLEDKAIAIINKIVDELDCKYNRKGALFWRTATHTFFVSQRLMDDVLKEMRQMKIEDTPREGDRLQMLLSNRGFFEKSPMSNTEIIWLMAIKDFTNDWGVSLTMLAVKNEKLNVKDIPVFDGELVLLDRQNKKEPTEFVFGALESCSQDLFFESVNTESPVKPEKETSEKVAMHDTTSKSPKKNTKQFVQHIEQEPENEPATLQMTRIALRGIDNDSIRDMQSMSELSKVEILSKNHLYSWLVNGIKFRQIKVNEPEAFVHVVEDFVLLVTPRVFTMYLKRNPLRDTQYESISSGKPFIAVQHEFDSLKIHVRDGGSNHQKITVFGKNRSSKLSVYAIPRKLLPVCDNFKSNSSIVFQK